MKNLLIVLVDVLATNRGREKNVGADHGIETEGEVVGGVAQEKEGGAAQEIEGGVAQEKEGGVVLVIENVAVDLEIADHIVVAQEILRDQDDHGVDRMIVINEETGGRGQRRGHVMITIVVDQEVRTRERKGLVMMKVVIIVNKMEKRRKMVHRRPLKHNVMCIIINCY